MIRSKRGDISGTTFFLLEMLLGVAVLLVIGLIIVGVAKNTTFFQSFYAKDNAYVIEALHAVPNGELQLGYLWDSDTDFIFSAKNGLVTVQTAQARQEGITRFNTKTKAFGTSEQTEVPEVSFTPFYYRFIRSVTPSKRVDIIEDFNILPCPRSQRPLPGIKPASSEQGFDGVAEPMIRDILSAVRAQRAGSSQEFATDNGYSVRLHLEQSYNPIIIVYYRGTDDQTLKLACEIAKSTSINRNTQHTSNIPEQFSSNQEQLIIYVKTPYPEQLEDIKQRIIDGIIAYWGDSSG